MDDRRFDALTRSLATGLSRRKVFKGLFGGAVLGGAAASGLDQVAAQGCPEGQFLCNDECCPNANNCCGNTTCCPSSQCNQGTGVCCESFEFACGTGDNTCCNTAEEKCCDGVCISAALCCPSLSDCDACETCVQGACQPIQCGPCETCVDGTCQSTCETGTQCCSATVAAPYCAECCNSDDCDACEECVVGTCVPGEVACDSGFVTCCIAGGLLCEECCTDADCDSCERCSANYTCEPLDCEDRCERCDPGVDACVPVCSATQSCCWDGNVECVDGDECCADEDCDNCDLCDNGICETPIILCEQGLVGCCVNGELSCEECCGDSDCDACELCHEGRCVPCEAGGLECCEGVCAPDGECCVHFGDECGLLVVTGAGVPAPPQLDCCNGLVCCEAEHGSVCAECCTDHECPKGWICCAGHCRELECCIDEIQIGLDPNRRCPDGCGCFEGICECHCQSNKDCADGACCCKDGTCSEHCCERGCDHDKDCVSGTCCCHDGSCSADCCKTSTPPVTTLPGTGSGSDQTGSGIAGAAALGAVAAYVAARRLRQQQPDEETALE